jgi:hypothetical protein
MTAAALEDDPVTVGDPASSSGLDGMDGSRRRGRPPEGPDGVPARMGRNRAAFVDGRTGAAPPSGGWIAAATLWNDPATADDPPSSGRNWMEAAAK